MLQHIQKMTNDPKRKPIIYSDFGTYISKNIGKNIETNIFFVFLLQATFAVSA